MPIIHASTQLRRTRAQRENPNRPRPVAPILVASILRSGNVMTLVFNQPVSLSGVPAFTTDIGGSAAVSAVQTAANTVEITFNTSIAESVALNVGFRDPAIRNASGGYVTSDTVIL